MAYDSRETIEKLEILAGDRPRARDQAAVRVTDLAELLQLATVKAVEVTTTPTAAQYNALLADVKELNTRLGVIANMLQQRLRV